MNRRFPKALAVALTLSLVIQGTAGVAGAVTEERPDYLLAVRAYADAMIDRGRDDYGPDHTPLFAEELDRQTMQMLEGEALGKVAAIPREDWGIRSHDRMLGGANPQHCENLYQVLYALAEITGEKRYADEADRSLAYFFTHCQSEATGLLCWGEHAGWDLRREKQLEKPSGDLHEFYRPWIFWDRCWPLADEACRRFAVGLWEHQIGDHRTGDFSRHATISVHGPGTTAPYARHGGFYIETWGTAYARTKDEVYLAAIESVLAGLERARQREGGYLVGGSTRTGSRRPYDVSLAVSLGNTMVHVPPDLAARLRDVADANDEVFRSTEGSGEPPSAERVDPKTLWSNAYGGGARAGHANVLMLRYRQTQDEVYRRVILQEAELYCPHEVDLSRPVWPGTLGAALWLMLDAHELTGDEKYLQTADRFARRSIALFLGDSPLPKASHTHDHYEAVTNGDTLMMALLRLWLVQNRPQSNINLVYTDR
ncbi:MAG: hypothetical protein GXX96_14975 [Planctomycetaceae bacterium]|nr:hypothetical protein [Planctomycetaceae bacterium]